MWNVIFNDMIPTIIIIVCSIALIFRIVYQKHRKMTIQLLSISVLYLVIYIPEMLMEFLHLCGVPEDVGTGFMMYTEFMTHYGNILLPFVKITTISKSCGEFFLSLNTITLEFVLIIATVLNNNVTINYLTRVLIL
jgi:hypothetical protein